MKNSKLLLISIFLCLCFYINCTDPPLDADTFGVRVTRITFGKGWDAINLKLVDTTRLFDPNETYIVYYEICFEENFSAGAMIKKKWHQYSQQFLEVTSFMPKNTKRICGEVHYYLPNQPMDIAEYEISVWWHSSTDNDYLEYGYADGVNQTFGIFYSEGEK